MYYVGNYAEAFTDRWAVAAVTLYWDAFVSIPSFVGILAFAYRWKLLSHWFWKFYLPAILVWNFGIEFLDKTSFDIYFWGHFVFLLPLYYGLGRLAFDKRYRDSQP